MRERILNLLSLCLQAKEKGIDAFLDYSPHVNGYDLRVFNHGWVENGNPDFKSYVYECHDEEEQQAIYEQSVSYLKGLIEA